jgi:hypothetical protein
VTHPDLSDVAQAFWSFLVPEQTDAQPLSPFLGVLFDRARAFPPAKKDYVPFQPPEANNPFFEDYQQPIRQTHKIHDTFVRLLQSSLRGRSGLGQLFTTDRDEPFDNKVAAGNPLDGVEASHVEQAMQIWLGTSPLAGIFVGFLLGIMFAA